MKPVWLQCEATNGKVKKHFATQLYQRDTDGLFVCATCVPQSTWRRFIRNPVKQRQLAIRRLDLARQQSKKKRGSR